MLRHPQEKKKKEKKKKEKTAEIKKQPVTPKIGKIAKPWKTTEDFFSLAHFPWPHRPAHLVD